jgi:rod shape-determining protein MreD
LLCFLLGTKEGAFLGFAGGIVEDLFLGSYIGLNALSKMAAGYLAGAAGERLYRENIPVATIVTFLASLTGLTVNYLLLRYLDIYISPLYAFYGVAIPGAAYTAVLAPIVFWRIFRYVQIRNKDF